MDLWNSQIRSLMRQAKVCQQRSDTKVVRSVPTSEIKSHGFQVWI